MKRLRKIISAAMALLLFLPLTVVAEEQSNAKKLQSLSSSIQTGATPKEERHPDKNASYNNPTAYPLIKDGEFVGTLVDGQGTDQDISFETISNYSSDKMKIQTIYQSDFSYFKDRYLSIELFSDNNSTLNYIGTIEFDTYGKNNLRLGSIIDKHYFSDKEFIFLRLGVADSSYALYYSDTLLFKVRNPFFNGSGSATTTYTLISNESVQPDQTQYSGQFQINNNNYTFSKSLDSSSYRLDVRRPFDSEQNRHLKVNTLSKLAAYQVGQSKSFWVYDFNQYSNKLINAHLLYSGTKANVWVHNYQLTSLEAEQLGREFDQKIHTAITSNFANESDVDGDGKINILAFDIQDGFQGSGGYIAGYFSPQDLYNVSYSNKSEIFYIDTYPLMGNYSTKDVTASYTTLAHEFQHMVNYNQNVFIEQGEDMDLWLDESLAMAAEQIYSNQALTNRMNYYNRSQSIANGHSLLYWDYYGDTLANYSLSYLFGQYVKIQANQGDSIFKEILRDPENNYLAIEKAVKKYIDSDMSFGSFMTNFRAALIAKNNSGLQGFKGSEDFDILEPRLYNGSGLNLRGGGAITKALSSEDDFSIPVNKGTDITYTLVNTEPSEVVDTIPPAKPIVNPVSDLDTEVSGYAESGSEVNILVNENLIGSGSANDSGAFAIPITNQLAGTAIEVYAVDTAGNQGESISITVIDLTPPNAPRVNEVKDSDDFITGISESRATITVYQGTEVLGSSTASTDGSFSVNLLSHLTAGTTLSITANDPAGNTSSPTTVVVKDGTAPAAPVVNQVRNYDKKVTGKAENGTKVTVKSGSIDLGTGIVDQYGSFSVTLKTAQKAGTTLSVTATDDAGNISETTVITVVDKTAPVAPVVNEVKDYDKKITGKAEPGSKITVKLGKTILGYANADKYGSFSVTLRKAQKAGTVLSVTTADKSGNISSITKVTVKDKTAPNKPSVTLVKDYDKKLSGKAEAGSKVTVKAGKTVLGVVTANKEGKFSLKLKKSLKAGTVIQVTAKDKAGNISTITKSTVRDKTAPKPPAIKTVTAKSTTITGKAEAYSTVYVKSGSKVIGKAKASKKGSFKIKISKQKKGKALYWYAEDKAGNTSKAMKIIVK